MSEIEKGDVVMPRYDYRCDVCEQTMEIIHSIKISAKKKCPKCGKLKLRKLINDNVSVIFVGADFWRSTDYINQKAKEKGMIHNSDGSPASHSKSQYFPKKRKR